MNGGNQQKKESQVYPQPMFCKKCGRKIPIGGKFCPACGARVCTPVQGSEHRSANADDIRKNTGAKERRNGNQKPRKGYPAVIAGAAVILLVVIVIFAKHLGGTSDVKPEKDSNAVSDTMAEAVQEDKISVPDYEMDADFDDSGDEVGFDEKIYDNLPMTEKQVKELETIYNNAYEDEKNALDPYIVAYADSYGQDGNKKESFSELVGITEDFYQAVNAYDPNLKNVIAADAANRYGNGVLGSYLVNKGVGAVLGDDELGRELRSLIETAALAGLEYLDNWDQSKNNVRSDAMVPLAVTDNYALIRSYGTISGMLRQLERNSGYNIADQALEERQNTLEDTLTMVDFWTEDIEELFNTYKISENYDGRMDAVKEKKQEWDTNLYQWKYDLLTELGISDPESVLQQTEDADWEDQLTLEFLDISEEEYEKLKEEYETSNNYRIIEETQGEDACDAFDAYQEERAREEEAREEKVEATLNQYVYSIMDEEGKVYSSFLLPVSEVHAIINEEGTCSVWQGDVYGAAFGGYDEKFPLVSIDIDGTVLYENNEESVDEYVYYPVSKSGNVLKKTFESDFEHGDYQILEFVQPDGKSEKLLEGGSIKIAPKEEEGCTDYFEYTCAYEGETGTTGIIDMTDGSLITEEEYQEKIAQRKVQGQEVNMSGLGVENASWGIRLNDEYILCDNTIYNESGEVMKELSEGRGVKDILYADGRYWVVTKSGWYYILDDSFEETLEPVELINTSYTMTDWGILVNEPIDASGEETEKRFTCLYDESGNLVKLFEQCDYQIEGFIVYGSMFDTVESGGVNLCTKEPVLLSTPETPISLDL